MQPKPLQNLINRKITCEIVAIDHYLTVLRRSVVPHMLGFIHGYRSRMAGAGGIRGSKQSPEQRPKPQHLQRPSMRVLALELASQELAQ
jgi:hypothetical protein